MYHSNDAERFNSLPILILNKLKKKLKLKWHITFEGFIEFAFTCE